MFHECTREASLVLSTRQCVVEASRPAKIYIMVLVDLNYRWLPANTLMCRGGATFLANDNKNVSGVLNLEFCLCKHKWGGGGERESGMVG